MDGSAFIHRLFERVDIGRSQLKRAAIEVGYRQARPVLIEVLHVGLEFEVLAPNEFRAFTFLAAFRHFDICPWPAPFADGAAGCSFGLTVWFWLRFPPVAEASAVLTARKAPVLFGWAEQVRATARPAAGRRSDTGGWSDEIGRDPRARGMNRISSSEAGARRARHQSPCSERRADGRRNQCLTALVGSEQSGDPAVCCFIERGLSRVLSQGSKTGIDVIALR